MRRFTRKDKPHITEKRTSPFGQNSARKTRQPPQAPQERADEIRLPSAEQRIATRSRPEHRHVESIGSYNAPSDLADPEASHRSIAPTVATNPETIFSEEAHSKSGTSATAGGQSIFSSANQSQRSLTTTLTTIQSQPASSAVGQPLTTSHHVPSSVVSQPSTYFSPLPALPPHMQPITHQPTTYHSAVRGNLLSDDASMLTLAPSSLHRRRNSDLDTNASIRALRSWGESVDSLPLSMFSQHVEPSHLSQAQSRTGAPLSERNSIYTTMDGNSIRSGMTNHVRDESIHSSNLQVVQDVHDEY